MNEHIEQQLTKAMSPGEPGRADGWDEIEARAARQVRRDRLAHRGTVALFVVALVGSFGFLGGDGILTIDPAQSPDEHVDVARFSWPHLIPGLLLLAAVIVAGLVASTRRPRVVGAQLGWRRYWLAFAMAPALYGPILLIGLRDSPPDPTVLLVVSWILKILSIPVVPALAWLLAERATEFRHRWLTLAVVWLLLGAGLVLTARGLIVDMVGFGVDRLWPDIGDNAIIDSLDDPPRADWTAARILVFELSAVVVLALLSALSIRLVRKQAAYAAIVLPVVVFFTLAVYTYYVAPFAFTFDFDPFWGDLVLGGVYSELLFPIFPFEPFGALAVSIASFSMTAMLWLWGGPVPPEDPEWWKDLDGHQDDGDGSAGQATGTSDGGEG